MARAIVHACILVSVIYVTAGHSTSVDPRCVYTFNVPTSDCGQTPGPSVDDQLLKSSVIALQAQVKQLASDNKQLASDNKQLASDVKQLTSDMRALREHNDKQDGELRNLTKDRSNSDPGRTNIEQFLFHVPTLINHNFNIINKRTLHINSAYTNNTILIVVSWLS